MKYSTLKRLCENADGIVYNILDWCLAHFDEGEEITECDLDDAIIEEVDSYFTYYRDAWDYLEDNNITDFDDAINYGGCTDVCGIASYYLLQECNEYVGDNFDNYEIDELDELEDDEDEEED